MDKKELLFIECINAQSLLCHFDAIETLLHDRDIDILCICETWLESSIDDKFLYIPNFNIVRCDAGRGAGVCVYYRDSLKIKVLDTGIDKIENIEEIWIQVQRKKFPSFIIGCIYRHPKALAASFSYLSDVFKVMLLKRKPIFILGDFNDDYLNRGNHINKVCKNLNLWQIIDKPTRITQHSSTLLDLIITNNINMIVQSEVTPSPIADHEMVSIFINIRKPKKEVAVRTYRCRKNYSSDIFCDSLLNETTTLNTILITDDIDKQVGILTVIFNSCLNKCAPVVTKEIFRPFAPWIDEDLKRIINLKNQL